jgi:hypothetical protein
MKASVPQKIRRIRRKRRKTKKRISEGISDEC